MNGGLSVEAVCAPASLTQHMFIRKSSLPVLARCALHLHAAASLVAVCCVSSVSGFSSVLTCTYVLAVQVTVAKQTLTDDRRHFDVVVACEDEEGEDLDVPLVSIKYK